MNMFIDTEFTCFPWEENTELISIGIVLEDSSEYYGCSAEFSLESTSEFVRLNVLRYLPEMQDRKSLVSISKEIQEFLSLKKITAVWAVQPSLAQLQKLYTGSKEIKDIHSEYSDWDFQLLQELLGCTHGLPEECNDLSSIIHKHHRSKLPKNTDKHDALSDARWNFEVWKEYA